MRRVIATIATVVAGFLPAGAVHAELTCDQLGAIAQATVDYRDQGYSLKQVLVGVEQLKGNDKLSAADLDALRAVVRLSFTREKGVAQIIQECRDERNPPWYCFFGGCDFPKRDSEKGSK